MGAMKTDPWPDLPIRGFTRGMLGGWGAGLAIAITQVWGGEAARLHPVMGLGVAGFNIAILSAYAILWRRGLSQWSSALERPAGPTLQRFLHKIQRRLQWGPVGAAVLWIGLVGTGLGAWTGMLPGVVHRWGSWGLLAALMVLQVWNIIDALRLHRWVVLVRAVEQARERPMER